MAVTGVSRGGGPMARPAVLGETPFAVVDVETTGIYPGGHDRVIEVAIVRMSPGLEIHVHRLVAEIPESRVSASPSPLDQRGEKVPGGPRIAESGVLILEQDPDE
jgi:DNA polymerase III epsilon subunit-like protein